VTEPSHCLVSFRGLEAPAWVLEALRDGRVPGVCLFAFNFRDLGQFQALTASLHEAAREGGQPPPLVAIDQEGGQLMAVGGGATELPGNMALGATRSPALARTALPP
jgi:beta-N-acetylhexosaminidase